MIEYIPLYINIVFILTTFLTLYFFFKAAGNSVRILWIILIWLFIQMFISFTGFYKVTSTMPPRFILAVLPPFITIGLLFFTASGKKFLDSLDLKVIIYLQVVRVPVEIALYLLSIYKLVPDLMTFEGMNYDIITGITAPFIAYFGITRKKLSRNVVLAWNVICFALLLNIVTVAILSAPFTFQKLSFDQPNLAVFSFPYVWLPCFIVPVAFLSHLLIFRRIKEIK